MKVYEICMESDGMPLLSNSGNSLGFKSSENAESYAIGAGLDSSEYIITYMEQ